MTAPIAAYGQVADADTYFETRLDASAWNDETDNSRKEAALITATQRIDRLQFVDDKTDEDQDYEFPRGEDETETPEEIITACYEEALALLDGCDITKEIASLNLSGSTLGRSSMSMNTSFIPEYFANGIASALAWQYLRPFLRDPRSILVHRVS